MSALLIGPYHVGEIPPPLLVTFKDQTATTPLDFTQNGPWTAKIAYRSYGGVWVVKACSVPSANDGNVTYAWVAADFAASGDFEGEVWVGNGGAARYDSIRLAWQVLPAAVPTPTV